jgi:hypothetical protein
MIIFLIELICGDFNPAIWRAFNRPFFGGILYGMTKKILAPSTNIA